MAHSESEENYLKALYMLGGEGENPVSTGAIAQYLSVQAASVTEKLSRMADKGLLEYRKSRGALLTHVGRKTALNIIRKHRLWELFLTEKLGFGWDEVHDLAEQLEHIESDELIARLDKSLGYPSTDPHGDPIPDAEGNIQNPQGIQLSAAGAGSRCQLIAVSDSSPLFLRYLNKQQIALGQSLTVEQVEDYDGSIEIKIGDNRTLTLSREAASNLFVRLL
jgi:DtxR family Mn-dependent transcriptional regulator